ncbi:hypothetical protein B0H67DRAFT_649258 [Lasiosphaeris hirsuta]|uniref:Uncharacterized protein n=1 Tax=Lasiosphaeris hirsuta TaxID=260670 RepID=A0AA39ZWC6_9PEZI|nr:hypothetical protein B0H67DRAFT_649258 [Lasiosphaeris hirsuta]
MDDPEGLALTAINSTVPDAGVDITELRLDRSGCWSEERLRGLPALFLGASADPKYPVVLYLLEGVDDKIKAELTGPKSQLKVPASLFENHQEGAHVFLDLDDDPYECVDTPCGIFSTTYLKLASHQKDVWEIEKGIESGRPWQRTRMKKDPAAMRIGHHRYAHASSPYRAYHPLKEDGGEVTQAAREGVSMWFGRTASSQIIGILLFDPPRKIRTMAKKYRLFRKEMTTVLDTDTMVFPSAVPFRDEFLRYLQDHGHTAPDRVFPECQRIVRKCALRDERVVLGRLSRSLDEMELSFSNEDGIRRAMNLWRGSFGRWRNTLFHQAASIRHLRRTLPDKTLLEDPNKKALLHQAKSLEDLLEEIGIMSRRLDGAYQAIMATMSIAESGRAIEETEAVSKLTKLAFFFIPLALVATIFGMNLPFTGLLAESCEVSA